MTDDAVEEAMRSLREAPGDDGVRRVLADVLLERGDPHGEYVALQLRIAACQGDRSMVQRANLLFRKFGRTWTKDVADVVERFEYRGGFPVRARLGQAVSVARLRAAFASPVMGTLEFVSQGDAPAEVMLEVLTSPRLPLLVGAEVTSVEAVAALRGQTGLARLRELKVRCAGLEALGTVLASVETLKVVGSSLGDSGLRELLRRRALKRLEISEATPAIVGSAVALWPGCGLQVLEANPPWRARREDGATVVTIQALSASQMGRRTDWIPEGTTLVELAPARRHEADLVQLAQAFARWPVRLIP